MHIHLGHHFFGAGNLGDDLMLAGFLTGMAECLPGTRFTCSTPFPTEACERRFPSVQWLPYAEKQRDDAIAEADVWLGLGGSPFQSALSRWFVDHLTWEAACCHRHRKPMYFLGVGVQDARELEDAAVREVCLQARHVWTRDADSAKRLSAWRGQTGVTAAADLSHLFLAANHPPPARAGRVCIVANFDHRSWPGRENALAALESLGAGENLWLVQESRTLPGAERDLHASLDERRRSIWRLTAPEVPGASLAEVIKTWPGGEWLLTARYHSALMGAWAGSRVVVVTTNEKLRSVAEELGAPGVSVEAESAEVLAALRAADAQRAPMTHLARARAACAEFAERIRNGR